MHPAIFLKPIWKDELQNCNLIFGTNAMEDLGYRIVNNKGQPMISNKNTKISCGKGSYIALCPQIRATAHYNSSGAE